MKSKAYRVGIVATAACVAGVAWAGEPEFEITRSTIDGGGVMRSTGEDVELSGTIAQFDAGSAGPKMTGGEFELTGGFWTQIPLGDCEDDGDVDLRDHDRFTGCATGPGSGPPNSECRCFDVNRDGHVDMADFAVIQTTHTGG